MTQPNGYEVELCEPRLVSLLRQQRDLADRMCAAEKRRADGLQRARDLVLRRPVDSTRRRGWRWPYGDLP